MRLLQLRYYRNWKYAPRFPAPQQPTTDSGGGRLENSQAGCLVNRAATELLGGPSPGSTLHTPKGTMSNTSRTSRNFILALLVGTFPLSPASGQDLPLAHEFDAGVTYLEDVPVPEEVIGHLIGTRHTRPHQLVEYFQALGRASDRVVVRQHAMSYEGRPLVHAIVTSPVNHGRLEDLRRQLNRLSDDPGAVTDQELDALPAVVYMGYSVHGNEASGSEAAALLLYHLSAGQGPEVEALLDSAIVIVDPCLNPDGRSRFVEWVNGQRGDEATSDGQDREHNEPWPGGRTNHYWFDLNRDWLPAQHPESQGRLEVFHSWRPQLLTDFHEMGGDATYFFQPGIPSRNNPNSPGRVFELTARLAEYHARGLDEIGSLYYTKESFDDFYYGKGSTYPDVNGGVGILFEQASSRALERETDHGRLSYARSIVNQFAASLTTLAGVRDMRIDFLRMQRDFYLTAPDLAAGLSTKAYLVDLRHRTRAQALVGTLQRHRVRAYQLAEGVSIDGVDLQPGDAYVIPTDQPQVRFLKAAMERVTSFTDSLFYDVSTWSFPLAFGVEVHQYRADPSDLVGEALEPVGYDGGEVVGGQARYAYVMEWDRFLAPRALYRALRAGVRPLLARQPFTASVGGVATTFRRGTVILPLTGRDTESSPEDEEIHQLVRRMADEDHVVIHALNTGLSLSGPDLGASSARTIPFPKVAVVTGSGTSAYEVGEVWHLLSHRLGMPVSLIDKERLERADLSRYNRLVLVNGGTAGDSALAGKISRWVQDGGVLIAQHGAVGWVLDHDMVDETLRQENDSASTSNLPYANVSATRGAQAVGGAALAVTVDTTHPLAFGLDAREAVFRRGTAVLQPSSTDGANVARYPADPLLSGYVSDDNQAHIGGSAAIIARRKGRGSVILVQDVLNFRAFWYGSSRFLTNALFFGNAF